MQKTVFFADFPPAHTTSDPTKSRARNPMHNLQKPEWVSTSTHHTRPEDPIMTTPTIDRIIPQPEHETTSQQIADLLAHHPNLTWEGFGATQEETRRQEITVTPEGRHHLIAAAAAVTRARAYLATLDRTKRVNRMALTSYEHKHFAERATGEYISNGALIVAALLEEVQVQQVIRNSPNAFLSVTAAAARKAYRKYIRPG